MNYLIYALKGRGKTNKAAIWQYRLNHLLQAIVSTGTGLDPENAWYVINPRHEYNIVNFQNRVVESQQFQEPCYEYIKLVPLSDQQGVREPTDIISTYVRCLKNTTVSIPNNFSD